MDILDKVIEHPVPENYYTLKEKAISVVKAKQLMNALKRSASNPRRFGPPPSTWQRPRNFPPSRPPPQFPQYNSTNILRWMNNIPVSMDLSRGRAIQQGWQVNGEREKTMVQHPRQHHPSRWTTPTSHQRTMFQMWQARALCQRVLLLYSNQLHQLHG